MHLVTKMLECVHEDSPREIGSRVKVQIRQLPRKGLQISLKIAQEQLK